jgi:hypothetical protein
MTAAQPVALATADKTRAGLVQALRERRRQEAAARRDRPCQCGHPWEHGGRTGETRPGERPESIVIRPRFLVRPADDPHVPVLPKLIKSRGLQLKMELLVLFDAQCRHESGKTARNVRRVTAPKAGDEYLPWRQLVLAESRPTRGIDRGAADLRSRQITEALRALDDLDLLSIPREPGGTRRIYGLGKDGKKTWQLQSEDSTPDVYPDYTVPAPPAA